MKWISEKIPELLKKDKIAILFLVGILFLVILIPTSDGEEKDEKEMTVQVTDSNSTEEQWTQEAYKKSLEEELRGVLSSVSGVGQVKVMITLASTKESVVKEDSQRSSSTVKEEDNQGGTRNTTQAEESLSSVYIQEDGDSVPYVVKEKMPAVEGVVIVAEGGDNSVVVSNISEAVKALFGIEAHKIKVMKLKS